MDHSLTQYLLFIIPHPDELFKTNHFVTKIKPKIWFGGNRVKIHMGQYQKQIGDVKITVT